MLTIEARNVNEAYNEALWKMKVWGVREQTRNGVALVASRPVTTTYRNPTENMLFDVQRDANPFFHVMESIWMLAGMDEVEVPAWFASNIRTFSDDGATLNGAYGHRWRNYFKYDQLTMVRDTLRKDPTSRRAVLGMWDANYDVLGDSKDIPCNTHIYFRVRGDLLDMTVSCRSNDIVWGCYGANAVHMSFLQEFVALSIGKSVGYYHQVSNNWHLYERHFPLMESAPTICTDYYKDTTVHVPLIAGPDWSDVFLKETAKFMDEIRTGQFSGYSCAYFNWVLIPMAKAWAEHKNGNTLRAINYATTIKSDAISLACTQWLSRRIK